MILYSHSLKNLPQLVVVHRIKGFSMISEADENVFLGFPCFLCDPVDAGNLISGSSNQFARLKILSSRTVEA